MFLLESRQCCFLKIF